MREGKREGRKKRGDVKEEKGDECRKLGMRIEMEGSRPIEYTL